MRGQGDSATVNMKVFTHGMTTVGFPNDIGGECADGVDGNVVGRERGETCHRSQRSLKDDRDGR